MVRKRRTREFIKYFIFLCYLTSDFSRYSILGKLNLFRGEKVFDLLESQLVT